MATRGSRPSIMFALSLALVLLMIAGPLASAGAFGPAQAADGTYAPDRVLVGFKPGTPAWDRAGAHASVGTKAKSRIGQIDVEVVEIPKGRTVPGVLKAYEKNPNVAFAEPDYVVTSLAMPNDPYYPYQWGLPAVNAPAGWDRTTGSTDVTVAVLDTGIDAAHPDLANRTVAGYDFVNRDADPSDDHGHGTTVAGILAANGNNGQGVAGVDWNARIMPVKVLSATGSGTLSAVAEGIVWATDRGAKVINMSLGGSSGSSALASAVDYAYGKGTTLVAGSGNSGTDAIIYPAAYPKVVAVGALDKTALASFSNYGSGLSLVAPGYSIYTTLRGGGYVKTSGTSMSTPFVAGLAALMYSVDSSLTPVDVERIMQQTASDLGEPGYDVFYGHGRIDVAGALEALAQRVPEAAPSPAPEPEPVPDPEPAPQPDPGPEPEPEPAPEPAPADTTAPAVRLASPADGAVVSGVVTVSALASDATGVAQVLFYANGQLIGTSTAAPYSARWNTRRLTGTWALTAIALDAAGNSACSETITVTVAATVKPPRK